MCRTRQGYYPTSVTSHGAESQKPFALRPDSKRRGGHVIGAKERWRELRAQGELIDAAARAAHGRHSSLEEGWREGMARIRERYPGVPLLVLGSHLDLGLAWATLKNGADGFVHTQMHPAQVLSAMEVVQKGELAAPRGLLRYYLLSQNENPNIGDLTARGREILELVVEGLSNAEIAGRLYLSESTIKQHLRAVYKVLGVRNRTEAAKTMREHARGV